MRFIRIYLSGFLLLLTACSSATGYEYRISQRDSQSRYQQPEHARIALRQLGTPYRYGGSDPRGFDCSGLVHYAYSSVGVKVPRSSSQLLRHAQRISLAKIRPGDLIFFRISGNKISHVGIYIGNEKFVHAPSSGKRVSIASISNPYWSRRLVAAGRI